MKFIIKQENNNYSLVDSMEKIEYKYIINIFEYHTDDEDYVLSFFDRYLYEKDLEELFSSYYGLNYTINNLSNFLIKLLSFAKIKFIFNHSNLGRNSILLIYSIEVEFENITNFSLWKLQE